MKALQAPKIIDKERSVLKDQAQINMAQTFAY
jgi:hypothetical protein